MGYLSGICPVEAESPNLVKLPRVRRRLPSRSSLLEASFGGTTVGYVPIYPISAVTRVTSRYGC
jgi:hypothetical protein